MRSTRAGGCSFGRTDWSHRIPHGARSARTNGRPNGRVRSAATREYAYRHGDVLMNTATGLTFASFLPPKMIESMLQHEALRMGGAGALDAAAMKRFEHAMSETRRRGLARVAGTPIPGVNALAASIFEANGNIVLAMTTMGPTGIFDPAWDGEIAAALRSCADTISPRLGYMPSAIATAQKTSTKLTNRNEQRRFDRLPARTVHRGEARHATAC